MQFLFNVHFYPISSCLPSQEIKLSSCVSFINASIISLLFIKFQVAADEAMAQAESNRACIFNSPSCQYMINKGHALKDSCTGIFEPCLICIKVPGRFSSLFSYLLRWTLASCGSSQPLEHRVPFRKRRTRSIL